MSTKRGQGHTQLLSAEDFPAVLRHEGIATGLSGLDRDNGGMQPGKLWVITGTPGVGKTILALQLARAAATRAGVSTKVLTARDDIGLVAAWLLAAEAEVLAHHLLSGKLNARDLSSLESARQRLLQSGLTLWTPQDSSWQGDNAQTTPELSVMMRGGSTPGRVFVIDDVDVLITESLDAFLPKARQWARGAGFTLILTVPHEQLLVAGQPTPAARRFVDVLIQIRRESQFVEESPHEGEADLVVLRQRQGPTFKLPVAFQGMYSRFVDLGYEPRRPPKMVG